MVASQTAMLVLETDADYARFGIDRASLAEILAIGPHGVELEHRDDAPLAEHDARDLRQREVLEDAVVLAPGRAPERGHDPQVVRRHPGGLGLDLFHVRAHAGPGARGARGRAGPTIVRSAEPPPMYIC